MTHLICLEIANENLLASIFNFIKKMFENAICKMALILNLPRSDKHDYESFDLTTSATNEELCNIF